MYLVTAYFLRRSNVPHQTPSLPAPSAPLLQTPPTPPNAAVRAPEPSPAPVASVAPAPLPVATATARLAFELLMTLDLDRDGRLTQRDAGLAREAGLRFAVDLELGPGVRLELAGAERLAHAADVLAEVVFEGRGMSPDCPWSACWSRAPRRCASCWTGAGRGSCAARTGRWT
ncbi:hypothetical protein ACN28S_23065 [Cystobacter fuscus]